MIKYEPDDVLYYMVKEKYIADSYPTDFNELLKKFRDKINSDILRSILKNFDKFGYIRFLLKEEIDNGNRKISKGAMFTFIELEHRNIKIEKFDIGITDLSVLNELKKKFKFRIYLDWIKEKLVETWSWLWEHFVVTITVSMVTAYLTTRFIV